MNLPSGVVTFLFTDVENSTRLWERHGAAMRDALLRHDAIIQGAIAAHGGAMVKHTGDGVLAVFSRAIAAAAACIAMQRALQADDSGEVMLRSRMAFYTGKAALQGSDYRGTVLNRAARLMAAAHGGQILVSQSARAEIGDSLPQGVWLRDLGQRRLRDVPEPESVFQLVTDGLRSDFPPLRTLDRRRLDVPAPATALIGRARDVDAIARALRAGATRLVTVTGPGGTGKSRLSIELARVLVDDYTDGAIFVPLAAVSKAEMVLPAVAQALEVREQSGQALLDTLCEAIRHKNMLLVLDNFEQVVAAASVVSALLEAAEDLHVISTSRERLHLSGEVEHALSPLAQTDAVALFAARAQAVHSGFRLDAAAAKDIAEICVRLDGLPLAIELAAARSRVLPLARIRAELDDSLRLLVGGARDLPERHRTLRATIDWSFRLLDASEQTLFRRLAVFVDGATLQAIETVCGSAELDVVSTLESLTAKSLVQAVDAGGAPRFVMLETIREFARERLGASEEETAIVDAHAECFATLAESAHRHREGASAAEWFSRLDIDYENVRAALARAVELPEDGLGLRMCRALHAFWSVRGYLGEGRRWCEVVLHSLGERAMGVDALETKHTLAVLAARQGDYEVARPLFDECAERWQDLGDLAGAGKALSSLGTLLLHSGKPAEARRAFEQSVVLRREVGAPLGLTLTNLANVARAEGDLTLARSLIAESVELERARGDLWNLATALCNLSGIARQARDLDTARTASEEGLAIGRRLGAKGLMADLLCERGQVAMEGGDQEAARAAFAESLAVSAEIGEPRVIALVLELSAVLAAKAGKPFVAARNLAAATRIRDNSKASLPADHAAWCSSMIIEVRALCGDDDAFDEAIRAGRSASLESALAFASQALAQ